MSKWTAYEMPASGLPEAPCVYVFYLDGMLAYIGQTVDLRARMGMHKIRYSYSNKIITPWGYADKVTIKVAFSSRYGDWAMRELRLIRRLEPKHNLQGWRRQRVAA